MSDFNDNTQLHTHTQKSPKSSNRTQDLGQQEEHAQREENMAHDWNQKNKYLQDLTHILSSAGFNVTDQIAECCKQQNKDFIVKGF